MASKQTNLKIVHHGEHRLGSSMQRIGNKNFLPQRTQRPQRKNNKFFARNTSVFSVLSVVKIFLFFSFSTLIANGPGYFPPWGKDSELILYQEDPSPPKRTDLLSMAAEQIILFHQNIISPVDGPRSHFRPTSARYMLLAIRRYGFFMGYIKGCDRLLRENKDPWIYRTRTINNVIYKWDPTYT